MKKVTISVCIDEDTKRDIDIVAEGTGLKRSYLINTALKGVFAGINDPHDIYKRFGKEVNTDGKA